MLRDSIHRLPNLTIWANLVPKALFLGFGAREKRPGVRGAGTRDDPLKTSAWEASPEDEVAFERRLFLMFLQEVAYYATNNSNHVVFFCFFSLSFLKVCFHTILNKSKKYRFSHQLAPRCLVCAFDWLQASISSHFTALLPIRWLSFLSHMQVPLFWITVFVNIPQLFFNIYIFSNLNMIIRSSNSCFCLYTEEPKGHAVVCLHANYQLMKKWSILLARTRAALIPFISIWFRARKIIGTSDKRAPGPLSKAGRWNLLEK